MIEIGRSVAIILAALHHSRATRIQEPEEPKTAPDAAATAARVETIRPTNQDHVTGPRRHRTPPGWEPDNSGKTEAAKITPPLPPASHGTIRISRPVAERRTGNHTGCPGRTLLVKP